MIVVMKHITLLLTLSFSLLAQNISATYDVTFSIFGKIGEAKISYAHQDNRYHIKADAGLTGEAASIGANRREVHESFGIIKEGVLIPELYKVVKSSDYYHHESYFVFYPDAQKVEEHRINEDYTKSSHFDVKSFKIVSTPKTVHKNRIKTLKYFAQNDLESLFFNVQNLLLGMQLGDSKVVHAVGGSNKKGEILLTRPNGSKRDELIRLMPKHNNQLITVVINQNIFKSDKGELYISLDEDLLVKEAMLKDVVLFGDIHGYRTALNKVP